MKYLKLLNVDNPNDEVYLEWKTPSGFVVVQRLMKRKILKQSVYTY